MNLSNINIFGYRVEKEDSATYVVVWEKYSGYLVLPKLSCSRNCTQIQVTVETIL